MNDIITMDFLGVKGVAFSRREGYVLGFMHNETGPSGHFYKARHISEYVSALTGEPLGERQARDILKRFDALGFLSYIRDGETTARCYYFNHDGNNCDYAIAICDKLGLIAN